MYESAYDYTRAPEQRLIPHISAHPCACEGLNLLGSDRFHASGSSINQPLRHPWPHNLVSGRFLESYSRQVESLRKDKDGQRHASNGLVASCTSRLSICKEGQTGPASACCLLSLRVSVSKAAEDVGRAT